MIKPGSADGARLAEVVWRAVDRRRKAVAIEPMTCPPNAFVTAEDLLVLEPGQQVTQTWGIQVLTHRI